MAKKRKKTGKISSHEFEFIKNNHDILKPEQIAERLNRTPKAIEKVIASLPAKEAQEELGDFITQLHNMADWLSIKAALIGREVQHFEAKWSELMEQFSGIIETQATDRMMIKDLAMFDVLFHRAMAEKNGAATTKKEYMNRLQNEMEKSIEGRDQALIAACNNIIADSTAGITRFTKEASEYQDKKDGLMKQLKGTREQRFKQQEEARTNIFDAIKEFNTDKKMRAREGRLIAKVKHAADKTEKEWTESNKYDDGSIDSVFLKPEDHIEDKKNEEE